MSIRELIEDRDTSDPVKDMLRHTREQVCFYDTGFEINEPYDDEGYKEAYKIIKNALKIKGNNYKREIDSLLVNASYGGRVVVYFLGDVESLSKTGDKNRIVFKNPAVAIIDTCNGSGSNEDFNGLTVSFPLDIENLFLDKTIKYNYTFEVCAMSSNWCNSTSVSFTKQGKTGKINKSTGNAEIEYEKKLNETFKNGSCTPCDMDMRRHRDTYYLNEFPCGTHCPHCHTFWID